VTNSTWDHSKVFVLHGRNLEARNAMHLFLRSLGLEPIDFETLAADQGGTAFIADIVRAGMEKAYVIMALFTPDEISFLAPHLSSSRDSAADLRRWQSRPNVIFEAGMAFALAPKRTVLVTFGADVTLFSDLGGVHTISVSNTSESRSRLRQKLIGMGSAVDEQSDIWTKPQESGDFEGCISQLPEVSTRALFR
jgi:predicted nucleotide-binding protein